MVKVILLLLGAINDFFFCLIPPSLTHPRPRTYSHSVPFDPVALPSHGDGRGDLAVSVQGALAGLQVEGPAAPGGPAGPAAGLPAQQAHLLPGPTACVPSRPAAASLT